MTRYYAPYRYRARSQVPGRSVAVAAAAAVVLGAGGAAHSNVSRSAAAAMARPPALTAASSYTPATWSRAFLVAAGYNATACNTALVLAWIVAEGSDWSWRNPLDDELPEPGSYRVNTTGPGQGVQAYPSWALGLRATVITLSGPDYPAIRAALAAGDDAQRGADAVAASEWGTEPFEVTC